LLALALRRDARAQHDQAVALEDVHRRIGMHARQHAQVRHHEDRVLRQRREAFGFEAVD
jgi:hypothetical protein